MEVQEVGVVMEQEGASLTRMLLISTTVLLPGLAAGSAISFPAVALPHYLKPYDPGTDIVMTDGQASWFVSLTSSVQMFGNLIAIPLVDRLGRKLTLVLSSFLLLTASMVIRLASTYPILLSGCVLAGTSVGIIKPATGLYISEVATVRWRGCLTSFLDITPNIGYLVGVLLGGFLPFPCYHFVIATPCLIFLPLSLMLTDTPLWLTMQGRVEEAKEALAKLRGPHCHLKMQLKELEFLVAPVARQPALKNLLNKRSFLLPVTILSLIFCTHTSVGMDVISYYGMTLLAFPGVELSISSMLVFFQAAITLGMVLSPLITSRVNRRPHFILGSLAVALFMILLGLDNLLQFSSRLNHLPLILVLGFGFIYGLGVCTVPYTLTGELFPQQTRAWGCGLSLASRFLAQFVQLKVFLHLVETVGIPGFYWSCAVAALLGGAIAMLLLPETRGKTFAQLEVIFTGEMDPSMEVGKPKQFQSDSPGKISV